jgi:flagellar basal body rod protein FlgB
MSYIIIERFIRSGHSKGLSELIAAAQVILTNVANANTYCD